FQAEDGIRDRNVTGVQTCALPIYILTQPEFKDVDKIYGFYTMLENEAEIMKLLENKHQGIHVSIGQENEVDAIKDFSLITATYRSEERRVGKECRLRR